MKNYLIGLKSSTHILVFLGGSDGKESACNAGDMGLNTGLESYSEREWLLTPVFHGKIDLADRLQSLELQRIGPD